MALQARISKNEMAGPPITYPEISQTQEGNFSLNSFESKNSFVPVLGVGGVSGIMLKNSGGCCLVLQDVKYS